MSEHPPPPWSPRIERLRLIVEETDSTPGKVFNLTIQGLIILTLITSALETLPGLTDGQRWWFRLVEIVTVALFTGEYVLRVIVARKPLRFIFSFYGLVDLLAILPFYLALGMDLRVARSLRLLRLFRILKLTRYSKALRRLGVAFRLIREELVIFLAATVIVLYLAAAGIYHFEHTEQPDSFSSIPHSLWWAVATLTTVGYGDVYPVTTGGKVFTFVVLLAGLGVVSVPSGLLASALAQAREQEPEKSST